MKALEESQFPDLQNILKNSIFSESNLSEGFSDTKALHTIEVCNKHINQLNKHSVIEVLIQNILIESLGRNVGSVENYGFGYPFDFLEKLKNKMESEISEGLIYDIMEWAYGNTHHEMIIISKNKQDEYFFQSTKDPREIISYQTMSDFAYKAIAFSFSEEYERFKSNVLAIPQSNWLAILAKDETIEKYL